MAGRFSHLSLKRMLPGVKPKDVAKHVSLFQLSVTIIETQLRTHVRFAICCWGLRG